MIRPLLLALALAVAAVAAAPAQADESGAPAAAGDDGQKAQAAGTADDDRKPEPAKKGVNLLVVPLPLSDPALGSGVVLITGLFYSPVEGGRQWVSGLGVLYTNTGNRAFGLAQQADLLDGKLRLSGFGGYGSFKFEFFGIGQNAGAQGRFVTLDQKGVVLIGNGLYEVRRNLYVGARYRFLSVDSSLASPLFPDHPMLPTPEFKTRISGLGPSAEYDTRDAQFTPHKGLYINGQWLFDGSGLGSDYSYNKLTVAANGYAKLGPRTVLAGRASICDSTQGAPFYDLCFFGSQHDLRGYQGGQYRDHAMFAVQGELRQALFGRFGAVAFAGVGAVAPSFGDIGQATPLPSAGLGLRYQPSRKIPVNISVDYAWGKNTSGLYLYVGEAF